MEAQTLTLLARHVKVACETWYLRDADTVAVACVVTIIAGETLREPEPDLTRHIGELWVSIEVILAMRSPVFEAELYGPVTMEMDMICNEVDDMRPGVLRALLHFVYTDSLPVMDDLGDDEMRGLVKVRYAMDRLKAVPVLTF
ncbi:hypothetical protein HU200_056255 [Digitaria exilis]|uniref:BTB domain-containing protein n=1 Tax=Digitaria exilis TaxID=1010633 RepID=A0A835ADA3_9POAL|nr:hypothetical protein HU200_056255 [Digitaria exilis]